MKTRLMTATILIASVLFTSSWSAPDQGRYPHTLLIGNSEPLGQPAAVLSTGSISGTIYESDGVTPITDDARVDALDSDTGESMGFAEVNPDGTYTIPNLADSVYRVSATAAERTLEFYNEAGANFQHATPVSVTGGGDTPNVDFTLDPGGTITGVVYADDGVTPLANVTVDTDFAWARGCSAVDGTYKLSHLPLDTPLRIRASGQDLCVGPDNYVREWWEETANYDLATPIILTLTKPTQTQVNFTLESGGSISGFVFEADGITPIQGASVWAENFATGNGNGASTDAMGYYQIQGLGIGDYRVRAEADGSAIEYYDNAGPNGDFATHVAVTTGSDTPNINFSLDPGGTISGVVYALDGVTPQANVNVGLDNASVGACSNLSGAYTIFNVPLETSLKVYAGGDNSCPTGSDHYEQEWWQETLDYDSADSITLTSGTPNVVGVDFTLREVWYLYLPLVLKSP